MVKCGCTVRKELKDCVLHSIFTGFGASYKLTGSWTLSWPGPRADTSWALFSLYKVNYTPGGCHSLHKWGNPEMKPYHKIMCQHRDSHWGNPAELLFLDGRCLAAVLTATGNEHIDETRSETAGVAGVTGVALPVSKWCLFFRHQFEDNLWSTV